MDLITMRKGREEDIPLISSLLMSYLGNYEYYEENYLKGDGVYSVVAQCENKIVGAAVFGPLDNEMSGLDSEVYKEGLFYDIIGIAVDVDFRKKNLAEDLIRWGLAYAAKSVICQAWCLNGHRAKLDNALVNNGFRLKEVIDEFWLRLGDCYYCVERRVCDIPCSNHVYVWEA